MTEQRKVVGIDVSKAMLDCSTVSDHNQSFQWANDALGIEQLIKQLQDFKPDLIVLEASGGYETAAATALASAMFRVAVVNPRQVRDFAKATGQLAKTDRIDARILAQFGLAIEPQVTPLPEADAKELQGLLARRSQLVAMRTQELNRMAQTTGTLRPRIKDHIAWLNAAIRTCDVDLTAKLVYLPGLESQGRSVAQHAGNRRDQLAHADGRSARAGAAQSPEDLRPGRRSSVQSRQR